MPIHSDSYLNSLIEEAEQVISEKIPCIFNRFSLAITANTSVYTLPSNLHRILWISYLGTIIQPIDWQDFGNNGYLRPQDLGLKGLPNTYLRVGNGWNKIQFYPIPSTSISAITNDTNIDLTTIIKTAVIVNCYRIADVSGSSLRLPQYLFRNIMKYYAMARAYAREGPGQNIVASQYFLKKYESFLDIYSKTIEAIPKSVPLQFGDSQQSTGKLPRPHLPTSGKWAL